MWQEHYSALLNVVNNLRHRTEVTDCLDRGILNYNFTITPDQVLKSLKTVKRGKSCGVDGIAAELALKTRHNDRSFLLFTTADGPRGAVVNKRKYRSLCLVFRATAEHYVHADNSIMYLSFLVFYLLCIPWLSAS